LAITHSYNKSFTILQLYAKTTSSKTVHWSNGSEEERIFAKVLLKSIEYFWAQKILPIPSGKGMGHTSTKQ